MSDPLLILGATARAAASSAKRAGFRPSAIDLFCDVDLDVEVAQRSTDYPDDLPALASRFPPSAWMYTGALENAPRLIDVISTERPCWGTTGNGVRAVRDPWQVARTLQENGQFYPRIERWGGAASSDIRWIEKPFASAGGDRLSFISGEPANAGTTVRETRRTSQTGRNYLQQFIEGPTQSGLFVAASGQAVLMGVTRQLTGEKWAGADGFRYTGSIGPLDLSESQRAQWQQIGDCLAGEFELQGLFGVDAIIDGQHIWTIEINPRYTSSIEVLEYGLEFHSLQAHVEACRDGRLPPMTSGRAAAYRGKAVVYATNDIWIDDHFPLAAREANEGRLWPMVADIPTAGQTIKAGHPIVTLFVNDEQFDKIEPRLRERVLSWRSKWKW